VEMVTSEAAAIAGLGEELGTLAPGRPADLVVFERRHPDAYENIVTAEAAWVSLVMIGGDMCYGRADWIRSLSDSPAGLQELIAWGQPMLLDTGSAAGGGPAPTLTQLRTELIGAYPQVGPIFV
jgi:5-methylthioadenosine/S-adenosylhomocysteine deaminase